MSDQTRTGEPSTVNPAVTDAPPPTSKGGATDAMFNAVYDRLKAMAARQLGGNGATLNTTGLVHELYLRVSAGGDLVFSHDAQFFAYAAQAMRHYLVDRARAKMRMKAGGDWVRATLTSSVEEEAIVASADQALALDRALTELEANDARAARVVELRYFAGLPAEQVAELLGLNRRTVERDWCFARAFLHAALE